MAFARNFRFALPPFLTPSIFSFTSEQAAWPATNALLDTVPRRPWKTTVKNATQTLVLDFGATTVVEALLIAWTNYPYVDVGYGSSSGGPFTSITPSGYTSTADGLLIPQDPDLLRRRLLVDMTGGLFNARYMALEISANLATDDNFDFYSTGAITLAASLQTMPDAMAKPPNLTFPDPENVNEFPSGAKEFNKLGVPRVLMDFGGPFIDESAVSSVRAIDRIGTKPFIVYPNVREGGQSGDGNPNPSKAYLMRRVGDAGRSYDELPELFSKQFQFEEVV